MIPDKHIPFLTEMRAITKDANGELVLVGLSADETKEYVDYIEARWEGRSTPHEAGDRYLALHEKHEKVRIQIICAEAERRGKATN